MLDLGGIYPAALNVFDVNGNPVNAGTITLTITLPDGTTATPTPSNPATGQYTYSYQPPIPGRYMVRWVTTTPGTGYTDTFDVAEAVPPSILSLAEAKVHLQIDPANTEDDTELREMLMGLTAVVENYKQEVIAFRTVTEDHTFAMFVWNFQAPRLRLWDTPVIQLLSVVSNDLSPQFTWNVANLDVDNDTGIVTVLTGPPITGDVTCVYTAGYQVIPYNYLIGAKIALQHIWETRRGVGGLGGAVGPEELHIVAGHAYLLPKKAIEALGPPNPVVA